MFTYSFFLINFAGMKRRFFLIFVLLTGAFSALAQIRVEMNNGGAQLRPMNLSDYDRHEEPFALTHADSVDYQSHVVRAYNYLATDSLPQARTHLKMIFPGETLYIVVPEEKR